MTVNYWKSVVVFVLFFCTNFLALGNSELFSTNPTVYEEIYGLSDLDIRMFLTYAPLDFIIFGYPFLELFSRNQDLRMWIFLFISCVAFGSILRMIPLWLNSKMVWLFHVSQMIIPLGTFAQALPPQIAVEYFSVDYRGFVTATLVLSSGLGPCVLRNVGAKATTVDDHGQVIFYVEGLFALIIFLLTIIYMPKQPEKHVLSLEQKSEVNPKGWLQSVMAREKFVIDWAEGVIPIIVAVAFCQGLKACIFANMTSLLAEENVVNTEAAWIDSISGYSQIIGATILGYIMTFRKGRSLRRNLLIWCFVIYGILSMLFSLSFSSYFWSTPPLPYYFWLSMTIEGLSGVIWACMRPIAFEYIAQLSYPIPSGYFAAWVLLSFNCVKALSLLIPTSIAFEFLFVAEACAAFFSVLVIWQFTPVQQPIEVHDCDEGTRLLASVHLSRKVAVLESDTLYVITGNIYGSRDYVLKI